MKLADKSVVRALGKGRINLYLQDENDRKVPVTFTEVLYVPNMKRLISISQLVKPGSNAEVTFKEKSVVLSINGRRFVFGNKVGKLYEMNWCYFAVELEDPEVEFPILEEKVVINERSEVEVVGISEETRRKLKKKKT